MTQRDQVSGAFGSHDAGQSRDAEDVAFLGGTIANHRQRGGLHADTAGGDGDAAGFGFFANTDHQRAALIVKMCKVVHEGRELGRRASIIA